MAIYPAFKIAQYYREGQSIDGPLFVSYAKQFLADGKLYVRSNDLTQTYRPNAAVYKYPPPYLLTITPWFTHGDHYAGYFQFTRIVLLVMYLTSCLMLIHFLNNRVDLSHWQLTSTLLFGACLWYSPFLHSYAMTIELLIVFFMTLGWYLLSTRPLLAGLAWGCAIGIKLYPALLLVYCICRKEWRVLTGVILGLLSLTLISLLYFGWEENYFYLSKIIPVLLAEKMDVYLENLSLGVAFYKLGFTNNIGSLLWSGLRWIAMGCIMVTCIIVRKEDKTRNDMLFAMTCSGMLIWLPNYIQQYLLILVIPFLVIAFHAKTKRFYGVLFLLGFFYVAINFPETIPEVLLNDALGGNPDMNLLQQEINTQGLAQTLWKISPVACVLSTAIILCKSFAAYALFLSAFYLAIKKH